MDRSSEDSPILIGQSGPLNGERWVIVKDIVIGRDEACDVMIPDRQVSRYHARLSARGEDLILEDLSSKNGTYLNGLPVTEPAKLQDGDTIQIAMIQNFVFLSSDATVPLSSGMGVLFEPESEEKPTLRLYLDKLSRRVLIDGREILPPLSVPQFRLLEALYDAEEKVVSRQELVVAVWSDDAAVGVSEQALDALIRRLRDRIAVMEPNHNFLVTVRGYGLRLDNPQR